MGKMRHKNDCEHAYHSICLPIVSHMLPSDLSVAASFTQVSTAAKAAVKHQACVFPHYFICMFLLILRHLAYLCCFQCVASSLWLTLPVEHCSMQRGKSVLIVE